MRCPNIMIMAINVEPDEMSQNAGCRALYLIRSCSVYDAGRLDIQFVNEPRSYKTFFHAQLDRARNFNCI